jgi:hypothetical protein
MFRPLYLREETTWHPLVGPQSWSKRFLKKSIIDPRLLGCPAPWLYAAWPIAVPTHRLWNAGKYCLFLNTKTQKRIWPFELGFTTACWPSCFAVCVRVRKIPQQKDTQGRGGTVPPLINISPPPRTVSLLIDSPDPYHELIQSLDLQKPVIQIRFLPHSKHNASPAQTRIGWCCLWQQRLFKARNVWYGAMSWLRELVANL